MMRPLLLMTLIAGLLNQSNLKKFFGKYEKPKKLILLEQLQYKNELNWEELELWIEYDWHYSVTPLDVIPFARTGSNGIHFGFLTDFNSVKDLKNAPIVCVAPTYDPPINLVARNLDDFFSLCLTVQSSVILADIYQDDQELKNRIDEWSKGKLTIVEESESNKILADHLSAEFIDNPFETILQLKNARINEVSTMTMDGLGIKLFNAGGISDFNYSRDPSDVETFLSTTNLNSRIKFYRNATFSYILNDEYDKEIKEIIMKYLRSDGFKREANILKNY